MNKIKKNEGNVAPLVAEKKKKKARFNEEVTD